MSEYHRVSQPDPSETEVESKRESEKLSNPRGKSNLLAYVNVFGTLAIALAIAIGHHLFYRQYDRVQVRSTSERLIKASGNALSQGFSLLVGFSGATSLIQIVSYSPFPCIILELRRYSSAGMSHPSGSTPSKSSTPCLAFRPLERGGYFDRWSRFRCSSSRL
jgi:hypothetical protein